MYAIRSYYEILVSVGDKVEEEQSLITVEGDKASMEVPARITSYNVCYTKLLRAGYT